MTSVKQLDKDKDGKPYGEGQASLLSLICCWCSNLQSKSVLGVKNVSHRDRGLSFRPMWFILNFFFNLICWRNLALAQTISFFGLGSWNKYLGHSSEKRNFPHSSGSEVFVLLSKFQSSCTLFGCEQRFLLPSQRSPTFAFHKPPDGVFPQHGLCLLIVVEAVCSSFPICT